jgi:CxxC motif-containing protein
MPWSLVRAWVSFTEYVIFESPAVIVDHSPPDIHKKHFVIDTDPSCDEDVDYLVSGKSISAWTVLESQNFRILIWIEPIRSKTFAWADNLLYFIVRIQGYINYHSSFRLTCNICTVSVTVNFALSDIRSYYVTVGYTYSGSELIDSYHIVPNTTSANNAQRTQVSVNVPKSLEFDAEIAWWRLSIYGFLTKYGGVLSTIKLGEDLCVQIFTLLHARTVANICTPTVIFKLLFIKEEDKDTFQRFMTSHPPNMQWQLNNMKTSVITFLTPISVTY